MKQRLKSKRVRLSIMAVVLLAATAAVASVASGDTVTDGNLTIEVEGGISPQKLSKTTPTPITLTVSGSVKTNDGSHPPVLKTVDFNRLMDALGDANEASGHLTNLAKL